MHTLQVGLNHVVVVAAAVVVLLFCCCCKMSTTCVWLPTCVWSTTCVCYQSVHLLKCVCTVPPLQFGKRSFADVASQQSVRDPYFNVVYNITENSVAKNDVLRVRHCMHVVASLLFGGGGSASVMTNHCVWCRYVC